MNFEEFQNQSRFYVAGALEPEEVEGFEREREKFGKKAEDFVSDSLETHPGRECTTKQYGRRMKAWAQGRQRETAMLVERAQRVLCESRKLLEQREMQLKQQEQFRDQRATIADEMARDTASLAMPP